MKDSDIATELLDAYELAGDVADTEITHPEMVQYHSTDWDFLISRMESVGFVCTSALGKVDVIKPAVEEAAAATVRFGTNLIEFDAAIDGCGQYGSVRAQAWDPGAQSLIEAESTDPDWTTPGDLDPAALASAAGAEMFTLRQSGHLTEEEVQSWADARLLWSRIGLMCGRARVQGFSKAVPGITIALERLGDRLNGNAWVSGVRHEISYGNWLTDLQIGRVPKLHAETFRQQAPGAGALLPGINGLHTAVVKALEGDPSSESRILIQIPSIDPDGEGDWARVATLDAGSARGSFFLPEVDDEVLVGFLDDDPRQPVVIGGLHSSAKAPPLEAADDNHERGMVSRSGMRILFNDEKTSLTIDTPGGNAFLLDEENGEISLADQNGNSVVLSSSGISMESASDIILKASGNLKLEGQMNLEMKAGTQFKAEGSAGLEVSSSAVTVVKGSLVQIN
jgi:Rhs element Vgr protein